jgi:hypothetical protein
MLVEDNKKRSSSFLLSREEQSRQKGASAAGDDDDVLPLETTVDLDSPTAMAATDFPLLTATEIATALRSLPVPFFHRIALWVLEVGIDGEQLLGLLYSLNPPESSARTTNTDNDIKISSDDEVKEGSSSSQRGEMEERLNEEGGGEDANSDPTNPSQKPSAPSNLP